jgi:small-conductance mechanosensitive channel
MRGAPWIPALLAVVAILAIAGVARGQDPIQILEIDVYERTVAPADIVTFNWTVRNIDVVPYTIEITAASAPGWQVSVAPTLIQNLSPNRAAAILMTVIAPVSVDQETMFGPTLRVTVFQDGAVVFVATRSASVTIPSLYAEKKVLGFLDNPLPAPLDTEWGVFLLDVSLWLLIAVGVLLVVIPVMRKVGSYTKTRIADVIIRIIRTPLVILLFLYGTIQSLESIERHLPSGLDDLLLRIYSIALTVILIYLAYRLFKDVFVYLARTVSRKTASHVDDVLMPIIEKVGLAIIGLAGLGLLLGYLAVDLTLFVAGGVVTSMVIAFAAQDTLSNFFSGLFILTDRPFKEGDIVILSDGDWAEVRRIGMRTTRLFRFSDASIVTLPNNTLVNQKIANFSNPQDRGRVMKTFNVAYGSDVNTVKRILREVLAGNEHIIQEDPLRPIVRFDAMSDSSLDFFVLVWIDDRANRFDVLDYLNTEIYNRFNAAGIEIPFPQRTVHMRFEGSRPEVPPPDVERLLREADPGDEDEATRTA